jgi:Concanavalin A-like lectin/glucanases superfamily/Chitobiase/beta-hexosaminidase C-terminal domain/IPT/TIG domain/Fibronectin type III domain
MSKQSQARGYSVCKIGIAALLVSILPVMSATPLRSLPLPSESPNPWYGLPEPSPMALAVSAPVPPTALTPAPSPEPQAQITVAVTPAEYGLTVSQSVVLAATVSNDSSGRGVTWTVSGSSCSGSACGTLSSVTSTSATYTAPTSGGVYLVMATSVANVTVSAAATIGVTNLTGVFTYRNDGTRSSINNQEYLLTPSNVNTSSFGKKFSCTVDESVYAQPLWVANAAIGGGTHNIVIVATQNDSVYAFDADNGSGTTCTLYWQASMLTTAHGAASGATPIPPADTGETGDIPTEIGITSTPVIDPSTNYLYLVSNTKEGGQYYQRLHRLNLLTGAETTNSPQVLAASVPGTGNGSSGGMLPYSALHQNQRPGLALVNGIVYMASGSHGDNEPWHGWILGYSASTMAFASAYCTTPNTFGGGIWMSGSAPVFDSSNNLYVISSNGTYNGTTDFADSFLKLTTTSGITLGDWFTPDDQQNLGANNIDLGQGGAVTLMDSVSGPKPHLLIGGGKEGILYLINRDGMGHYNANNNTAAVESWSLGGNMIAASGTFWQNTFYIGAASSPLEAFTFNTTTGLFTTTPSSQSNFSVAFPGLTPVISAAGTSNAILWTVDSSTSGTNGAPTGPAVLYAFDPSNLANEFWDSGQAASNRDQAGNAVKFVVPTVANGKVYVAGVKNLTVYGLLTLAPAADAPAFSPAPGGYTTPQTVTLSDSTSGATIHYTLDGTLPTTSSPVYSGPINVPVTTTIHAIAAASGLNNSPLSVGDYTIETQTGNVSLVQVNSATPQSPQTTVSVPYAAAQFTGDLNVVVVGWNDVTNTVSSVKDSEGNVYTLAVGPTQNATQGLSQSIYYAKNINAAAAGGDTVTVTFSGAAAYPDIRILEYSGLSLASPVDVTSSGTGNSVTTSTAAVTTRNAVDLLFAANMVYTETTSAGAGFTSRIITNPDNDIAEDRLVAATGSYSATATLNAAGPWVMQMVAFSAVSTPGPTVTSVSPVSGATGGGTAVTITGTNFVSGATVTFGSAAATNVAVLNATTITATAPAGSAGAATVTVTNPGGQSGSLSNGFTYVTGLTISNISPSNGPPAGGTAVTITGTAFAAGATVTFGSAAATNVVVVSATEITAATPAGTAGPATVTVSVSGQNGSLTNGFTYINPPTVASVSPNSGSTSGGTAITIMGTNFGAGATVTVGAGRQGGDGNAAATNVVVVNSTEITAITPAGNAGAATVAVTLNGETGNLTNGFTYVAVPTVTGVSPSNGPVAGGTAVTIAGTNFAAGATVAFGSAAATNVVVVSATQITATTPAGSAGSVTVTVTSGGQSGSLANGFTYVAAPTVTGVSPATGSTAGGTAVTITGTNFASGATVTFGSAAATNVVVVSGTSITATTPAGSAGAVAVTVTNPGPLSGSLTNGFTFVVIPTVTGVSPSNGPVAGGTAVAITGTNFAAGATVKFGVTAATNVVVTSSTQITVTTPAGSAGAVTVTVTVNGQTGSLANGFTYTAAVSIGFGQVAAATPQSATATVPVSYPSAQTAGDLNIVVVGWNDTTASVQTVKDSAGNNYMLAIGPTVGAGLQQSIYYASSIVGGSNTVTVTFSQAAQFPDVRILEYRGLSTLDVTAGASGNSVTASSGAAATTSANELIFGADMVATATTGAGSGFASRIITSPNGDIAEDKVVTTAGSNTATAAVGSAGPWVMQMVTFTASSGSSGGDTTPPTAPSNLTATAESASQINISWTASTDNVRVTGYYVQRCSGSGCASFAQVASVSGTTTAYNDTGLAGSTSYSYRVQATDAAGNLSTFSNTASATTSASTSTPGLVAAYDFNGGSGTTLSDVSGNGNTGTIVNATWTTSGKYGSALSFNGTNALVTINDTASLHLATAVTLEAWVNPSSEPTGWQDVIYKPLDNYFLEASSTSGNKPGTGVLLTSSAEPIVYGSAQLAANTWTHLAMTYDGTTLKIFVNGTLTSSITQAGSITTSTNALQIGGDATYGQYFKGLIDEVRVYNIALSQAQIQTDMATALP